PPGGTGPKKLGMSRTRQILFIQGGGDGAHDRWDAKLVDSLKRHLGDGYEVRYPRMPAEGNPEYVTWSAAICGEIDRLDDGAVVVGHSVGGTILLRALADRPPAPALGGVVLVAPPVVGRGGWSSDDFALPGDLGARLPRGAP